MSTQLNYEAYDVGNLLFNEAVLSGKEFAFRQETRAALRCSSDAIFTSLADMSYWRALRTSAQNMLLRNDDLFIFCEASDKASYCSLRCQVYGTTLASVENAMAIINSLASPYVITSNMFSVDWYFTAAHGGLHSSCLEELADDVLLDEAYPSIKGGVVPYIHNYLESTDSVLVLQGPPGTGKTRLIRSILGEASKRLGSSRARVLYTGDARALENEQLFVSFLTEDYSVFVVEDADHLLRPRADGNDQLHRFLTIADGIVRSTGKKIIFSTNLPNIGDIDEALLRPGRCFGHLHLKNLRLEDARKVLALLVSADKPDIVCEELVDNMSLASIYKLAKEAKLND